MSDFRPIMLNLPTYLKSDVINGRSLTQLCLIFLISTYSNAPLSQVPQNGLKGAAYSEVPNRRADQNKRAGLEESDTLLAYLLMPSPSAFSKFVLSVLKFLGILKF